MSLFPVHEPTTSQVKDSGAGLFGDVLFPEPFSRKKLFLPESRCSHRIVQVKGLEISDITVRHMKVEGDKILDDVRKRSMPRFR